MASLREKLSALGSIENLTTGKYGDGGGLFLVVRPNGTGFWSFEYGFQGVRRTIGLGPRRSTSLAQARAGAAQALAHLRAGRDPRTSPHSGASGIVHNPWQRAPAPPVTTLAGADGHKPRQIFKLPASGLSKLPPGKYGDGVGLYLIMRPTGRGYWCFRYTLDGHAHSMGLGEMSLVGLKEARDTARRLRQQLREGVDPLAERRAEAATRKATQTLREAMENYWVTFAPKWTKEYLGRQRQVFRDYIFPRWGDVQLKLIDSHIVVAILQSPWASATAKRRQLARIWLEAVLGWGTAHKLRRGENPALKSSLKYLLPDIEKSTTHRAALPFRKLPGFIAELQRRSEVVTARTLEFTILTAARINEVCGAEWTEFDLANRVWTLPAERTKKRRERRVPLSSRALAILEEMHAWRVPSRDHAKPKRGEQRAAARNAPAARKFVFMTRYEARSDVTVMRLIYAMGYKDQATTHGMRATFGEWVSERTSYPHEAAEHALGHLVGSATERAYYRTDLLDQRRQMMEDWARYCSLSPGTDDEKVVSLRRA